MVGNVVRVEIQHNRLHLPRRRRAQRGVYFTKRHVRWGEHAGKKPYFLKLIAAGEVGRRKSVFLAKKSQKTGNALIRQTAAYR
jgi:hypothetical protein